MQKEWFEGSYVGKGSVGDREVGVCVYVWSKKWKSDEEKELLFWGKLNECLGSFRENVRMVVLGNLKARVGNE